MVIVKVLNEAGSKVHSGPNLTPFRSSEGAAGDEDVDPGLEGGEGPLPPELHLGRDEKVPWAIHLPVQVHGAGVSVELPGAEVVLLVALRDGHDHVVPRVGGRGSDPEDLGRDDDVGLEAEVVVGDPQRGGLAVQVVGAADPLAAPVWGWEKKTSQGKSFTSNLFPSRLVRGSSSPLSCHYMF